MSFGSSTFEVGSSSRVHDFLVPKLFVWSHGGTSVFLGGSFTSWEPSIPMTPMKECPSVFQVVWRLPLGSHQYKFNVNGQWLYDEYEPFDLSGGVMGIVNTVNVTDLGTFPRMLLTAESTGLSHMEVDNGVFDNLRPRVLESEVFQRPNPRVLESEVFQRPNPSVLESEVYMSRERIAAILSTQTAYELLPDSGKVVIMDTTMLVKRAFQIFYEQGIFVAPVWDMNKNQFIGMLSPVDFILILKQLEVHRNYITRRQLDPYTIDAWIEAYQEESGPSTGRPNLQRFVHAGPQESLRDVAIKMLENKLSTVPIINSYTHGVFTEPLNIASLTGILKCICRYFKNCPNYLPILHRPIGSMPLGTWTSGESNSQPLAMLRSSASVAEAMKLLVEANVSSIVIVHFNDAYLDIYSRRDVMGLVKQIACPWFSLYHISIHEALLWRQKTYYPHELRHGPKCHMCFKSEPLHRVMARMVNPGVKQLVVVEAETLRVEGIISIGDLFRFFLS